MASAEKDGKETGAATPQGEGRPASGAAAGADDIPMPEDVAGAELEAAKQVHAQLGTGSIGERDGVAEGEKAHKQRKIGGLA